MVYLLALLTAVADKLGLCLTLHACPSSMAALWASTGLSITLPILPEKSIATREFSDTLRYGGEREREREREREKRELWKSTPVNGCGAAPIMQTRWMTPKYWAKKAQQIQQTNKQWGDCKTKKMQPISRGKTVVRESILMRRILRISHFFLFLVHVYNVNSEIE